MRNLNIIAAEKDQRRRRETVGLLFLFLVPLLLFLSFLLPLLLVESRLQAILAGLVISSLVILSLEISFRVLHRFFLRFPYQMKDKVPFEEIYFEPHPYLPYAYKKNFTMQRETPASYPLHSGVYTHPQLRTNNFRHACGPDGGRQIIVPKPDGLIRISCLGASTTDNYLGYRGKTYSYPLALEVILRGRFPNTAIEVNNCGTMGYTSADILVDFLLNTVDTDPDIVVFCHAKNDLRPSLTPVFSSDYSHALKSFAEAYHYHRFASKFPEIPLAVYNVVMNTVLHQNIRHGILESVLKAEADISRPFMGLSTYRRNIEHLLAVCRSREIAVILSTYPYFLYPRVQDNVLHRKYCEGVQEENAVVRDLATKHKLPLVENHLLMPDDERYFMDTVHFTPEGMQLLAENISAPIIELIERLRTGAQRSRRAPRSDDASSSMSGCG